MIGKLERALRMGRLFADAAQYGDRTVSVRIDEAGEVADVRSRREARKQAGIAQHLLELLRPEGARRERPDPRFEVRADYVGRDQHRTAVGFSGKLVQHPLEGARHL